MTENIKIYTLCTLIFLSVLSLVGFFEPFALVIRIASFVIPSLLAIKLSVKSGKSKNYLSLDKRSLLILPLATPSLLFIFFVSFIVSLIIYSLTGIEADVPAEGNFIFDIFNLAVIPAILEELLFRYVPLKTIAPYSKKTAFLISSLFFAMVHTSFFSIPYALVAGILFMLFDLIAESIWPSVILHLLNNIISIVWIYVSANDTFVFVFVAIFISLAALSLIPFFAMLKKYRSTLSSLFEKKDSFAFPLVTMALILPAAIISLLEFI